LARLSPRSWVAVPTFMASAAAMATVTRSSNALPPDPSAEEEVQDWPVAAALAAAAASGLVLCGVCFLVMQHHIGLDVGKGKLVLEVCSGMVFGCGLVISGMARPSKVVAFLDLGSGAWDPSLAFVMASALLITLPFFQILERSPSSPRCNPWLGATWGLPKTNPVELRLVLGSMLFGLGWGLCGVCPGPLWVLLLARPSVEATSIWLAMLAGMGLAVAVNKPQPQHVVQNSECPCDAWGPDARTLTPEVREEMAELGIDLPVIPGDMAICGALPRTVVGRLARHFGAWLYLNSSADPNFHVDAIQSANCRCEVVEMSADPPYGGFAQRVITILAALPRPLMLQCNSGNRASVLVLLALLSEQGRSKTCSKASAEQLAKDLDLKAFTRCSTCGPICAWVLQEVSASKALTSASIARAHCPSHVSLGAKEGASTSAKQLVFEQLFDEESSTFTYLLGCARTQEAVLIDPVLQQKDHYLTMLDELGLHLKYVIDTHCHDDHVTAAGAIRESRVDVKTVMSRASGCAADVLVDHGDTLHVGAHDLQVIATPGHTDACVSIYLSRVGQAGLIFTGDALLIRGCGRTDLQQGDAAQLYRSVHERLFALPGATQVFPGHDDKGRNMSTIEEEKHFNPRFAKTEDEFVEVMSNLQLARPSHIDVAVPLNSACGMQP